MGFTDNSESSTGFSSCSDFENLPLHPESLKSAQLNQSLGFSNSDASETESECENHPETCEINPAEEGSSTDDVLEVFQSLDSSKQQLRSASNDYQLVPINENGENAQIPCVALPDSSISPSPNIVQSENLLSSQEFGSTVSPLHSARVHTGVSTPAVEIALAPHIIAALSAGAFTFVVEGGVLKAVPVTPSERIVPSSVSVMPTLTSPATAAPENSMSTPAFRAPAAC